MGEPDDAEPGPATLPPLEVEMPISNYTNI